MYICVSISLFFPLIELPINLLMNIANDHDDEDDEDD
jgi:hypothetical protein